MEQGYKKIFKNKQFFKYTTANFINRLGDSVDMIAFSWLAYQISGSPSWSAIIFGINMLPNVLIQPFAGPLVERLSKKTVMIVCDIMRGILTGLIAVLLVMGLLNPWLLLIITFLNNTFESIRNPAAIAIQPMLLEPEDYEFGMAFTQTSLRICELLGVALAGIIIATTGIQGAIMIDVISFVLCALLVSRIHIKEVSNTLANINLKNYTTSLKEGFGYLKKLPSLIMICFLGMMLNGLLVPYNSFIAPYISGSLNLGADLLSFSNIALSIGMLIGAFLYPYLHVRMSHRNLLLAGTLMISSFYMVAWAVTGYMSAIVVYSSLCLASFLIGFGVGIMNSLTSVCLIQKVAPEYMARFSSIFASVVTSSISIISFGLSAISTNIQVPVLFLYAAIFTFMLFIAMMFIKQLKEL